MLCTLMCCALASYMSATASYSFAQPATHLYQTQQNSFTKLFVINIPAKEKVFGEETKTSFWTVNAELYQVLLY